MFAKSGYLADGILSPVEVRHECPSIQGPRLFLGADKWMCRVFPCMNHHEMCMTFFGWWF